MCDVARLLPLSNQAELTGRKSLAFVRTGKLQGDEPEPSTCLRFTLRATYTGDSWVAEPVKTNWLSLTTPSAVLYVADYSDEACPVFSSALVTGSWRALKLVHSAGELTSCSRMATAPCW